jgi:hypothetical protein
LRSLAAHQTLPHRILFIPTRFRLRADPRTHSGLRQIYGGADTDFPHLMRHSDNRGFWVPADFPEPIESNEPKWWRIGSVPRLNAELERIGGLIEGLPPGDDRRQLESGYEVFHGATAKAVALQLPVIIDG